jgi:hypothetical protein
MFRRECESIRPLISAFFDGDLTPSESMTLHQHLAECEECRRIVDEYQRIRSDLHSLPPTPEPPDHLANRILSETVDRPRPTGMRRVFGATTAKIGLSTVAALAILAVISAFLLVRGYNQGLTPSVVNSTPDSAQNWPVYEPIKIEFNKPMNHSSVEENLQVWPPGERDRIPISWDGNTLIVGSSSSQSTLFLPDTSYQVMVLGSAQDAYGHQLGKTWSVAFRTSPISTTAQQATPEPTKSTSGNPTPLPTQGPAIVDVPPTPTAQPSTTATANSPGNSAGGTPTATQASQSPRATATSTSTAVAPTPSPEPKKTATATAPSPTPSVVVTPPPSTPTTTATPTQAPSTPAATVEPSPTATETAPSASPSPDAIPVTGAFGSVYWANSNVQAKLGPPTGDEAAMIAAELGFQRGTMYERYDQSEIYVFFSNNQWSEFPDTWTADDGEGGGPGPDAGLWIPKESFWKVWNSDPNLSSSIGYAVEENSHLMDKQGGSVQTFANGIMLYSDQGFVYVVYNDNTWELYPDTSGHGDLVTPTPEAGSTPTSVPDDSATTPTETAPASSPNSSSGDGISTSP